MNDLFTLEPSPKQKTHPPLEADSLRKGIQALRSHNLVSWVERQNTGVAFVATNLHHVLENLGSRNDQ